MFRGPWYMSPYWCISPPSWIYIAITLLVWFVSPVPNVYVWHNFAIILHSWTLFRLQVWLYVATKKTVFDNPLLFWRTFRYMKDGNLANKMNSLARSNASLYGAQGKPDDIYDRLKRHAYQGKKSGTTQLHDSFTFSFVFIGNYFIKKSRLKLAKN